MENKQTFFKNYLPRYVSTCYDAVIYIIIIYMHTIKLWNFCSTYNFDCFNFKMHLIYIFYVIRGPISYCKKLCSKYYTTLTACQIF